MKHTFKRAMSLFMALAMVLTMVPSFGTHVHAEELETEPVVMTEEPATEAPVVEAPETEAAETEAPTQAPETEAPATEAPVVETKAPEVTEEAPEVVETEPAEETEAIEETFPEEILEEEIVEEEAVAASHALSTISGLYAEWTDASNSKGSASWSASGTGITGTATGYETTTMGVAVTTKLTLKNVSGGEAKLSFDYSLNDGSASVADSKDNKVSIAKNTDGSYAKVLAADDAITITLTSAKAKPPRANALTITGMSLISTSAAPVTTTFVPAVEGGTYSVNGVEVTAETSEEVVAGTKFTLTAVAGEGYVFFGWYDMSTDTCLDYNAEYAYTASQDGAEIVAKFVTASTALFGVGAAKFYSLTEAGAFAESRDTKLIVLLNDGVVTGSHSIPAGTTLLIPFDDKNTVYTDTPVCTNTDSQHEAEWVRPTAYRTLELAAGATISVSGSISISAKHFAGGSGRNAASPTENVGFVKMGSGSQITLNSGANLYAWGFVTGSGKVIAKSGAKVYENFQVRDFRGGGATSAMATDFIVFPMTQYYVQNIEVPVTFEYGAEEHVYTSLFMSGRAYSAGVKFIGDKAMFRPEEGCKLTKDYIESRDRLQLSVEGTASLASLTLSVEGVADIDSSVFLLPINSNITIEILSGTTTLCQDVSLLPGVELTVAKGAVLNVASGKGSATIESGTGSNVFVYDADEWNYGLVWDEEIEDLVQDNTVGYVYPNTKFVALDYVPGRTYTRTTADLKDVKLDINGTLVADGFLYTTAGGANITSSEKCGVVAMNSGAGEETFTYQAIQIDTIPVYCALPVASAQLRNGDGTYLDTTGAEPGATFNYCAPCDAWHASDYVHKAVEITWANLGYAEYVTEEYEEIGAIPEYKGATPTKATANCKAYTFAGWKDQDGKEYPTGTALPAATVDATYFAYFTESDAHSFTTKRGTEITAGTCMTEAVYTVKCDNCDAENTGKTVKGEKDPTNHTKKNTYVEGAKEATCGAAGYTGDTYCECGVVIETGETIPATGEHNYATEVSRTAATCMAEGSVTKKCECGAEKTETLPIDKTNHTKQNTTVKNAVEATCGAAGYTGDTYCECGEKIATGETIPATGNHNYVTEVARTAATCVAEGSVTKKCACGAEKTEVLPIDMTNHTGKNTEGVNAKEETCTEDGYTGDTVCECGEVIVKGEIIPAKKHAYAVVSYKDITETHHTAVYVCGNDASHTYDETVEHDYTYDPAAHTCACGQVEHFILTIEYIAINEDGEWYLETKKVSVPYGAPLSEIEEIAGLASEIYVNAFDTRGVYVLDGYAFGSSDVDLAGPYEIEELTMPGSDAWLRAEYILTGWTNYGEGWVYVIENEIQMTGWTAFDDGEGGEDWYYLDPETGIRAEGVARVPYPTEPINGFKYGPNAEDMANTDYNYPDATEAWFVFASGTENGENDGKFLNNYSGPANTDKALISWAVKGMIPWHVGMVQLDENVYAYFIGDEVNGGNVMATGDVYVIRVADNCERAFAIGGIYTFGENGLLIDNHGIVDMDNGTKRYYQNAQLMAGAGLIEVPVDNNDNYAFIFVRGNGELVVNTKYWVGANDLNVVPGLYAFDENGYMINPAPADKNGVFAEDGALYFYENGKRTYKGLIEYGDGIIYVTTSGKLATGKYYVTKTDLIEGYEPGFYFFDEEGYMEITTRNGIVDGKFYVDGEVQYGAGLIEYNDGMIYVKSNGQVVMDQAYWITNTNNLLPAGCYEFDSEGYLQIDENLDGVVGLNYYIDGVKQFGNGLVQVEDGYIYVKTNGELATGTYWITRTNGLMSAGCYEFDTDGYMILG